jgi:hypothetical protein
MFRVKGFLKTLEVKTPVVWHVTILTGKELTLLKRSVVPPTSRLGSPRREDEGKKSLRRVGKYLLVEMV